VAEEIRVAGLMRGVRGLIWVVWRRRQSYVHGDAGG